MYGLYTIKDNVANEFGPLLTAKSDAVAIRQFQSVVKSTDYPDDYDMYRIGSFDENTGEIKDMHLRIVSFGKDVYELKITEVIDHE